MHFGLTQKQIETARANWNSYYLGDETTTYAAAASKYKNNIGVAYKQWAGLTLTAG